MIDIVGLSHHRDIIKLLSCALGVDYSFHLAGIQLRYNKTTELCSWSGLLLSPGWDSALDIIKLLSCALGVDYSFHLAGIQPQFTSGSLLLVFW